MVLVIRFLIILIEQKNNTILPSNFGAMEKVTITSNEVGTYPDMVLKILDSDSLGIQKASLLS